MVLTEITLNDQTRYLVRVLHGEETVTDDVFHDDYPAALKCAAEDVATMANIHRQQIIFENRVTRTEEVKQ